MNTLVLSAGSSDSFFRAGYAFPKNLVEIEGKTLIQHVIENLQGLPGKMIFVISKEEAVKFHTDQVIRLLLPEAAVVYSGAKTSGAACTALLAAGLIDNDQPLLIANGDQILHADHKVMIDGFLKKRLDGGIPVFEDVHPRYSFVKLGEDGLVVEAAEKRPISRLATAGRYFFSKGKTFVHAAQQMILKDAQVEGVFYVCPSFNEAILAGARIGVERVEKASYISLGTPQAVEAFGRGK